MRPRDYVSTDEKGASYLAAEDLPDDDRVSRAEIEPDPEPRESDLFWPDGMPKVRHDGFLMNREWTRRYWERRGGWAGQTEIREAV